MDHTTTVMTVSGIIQTALAPAFLLTGIAAMLSMLTTRLARVVDRWRLLQSRLKLLAETDRSPFLLEAKIVWRRIVLVTWSIRFAVMAALLVCIIIALMFLGDFAAPYVGGLVAYLFVAAMVGMTLCFSTLLMEVSISTSSLRQGEEHLLLNQSAVQESRANVGASADN